VFGEAPFDRLLRSEPEGPKQLRLLCFSLKNGSPCKMFGKAPPKELEPESRKSPTKQALYIQDLKQETTHLRLLGQPL
jgi:hypothetical protein